ncbi:MAG: hypothetical protein PWP27_2499 [Clostridiales bacterium]|nr:hypothetical protein [Clostridiales bacterium]
MSDLVRSYTRGDSSLLFFIIVFLLLFYDNSAICGYPYAKGGVRQKGDSSILFFILVFLLLFYNPRYYTA